MELATQLNIIKELYAFFEYEGNYQLIDTDRTMMYNFYKTGFKIRPTDNLAMSFYTTNKLMNLDLHYQTFYQSKKPIFGFSFTYIPKAARGKYIK